MTRATSPSVLLAVLLVIAGGPAAAGAIPTAGLVARYDFNGNANDSVGGHDGIVHDATPTSNRFRNGSSSYSFNGTSAYIEIPDADVFSVSNTGQLSIAVWMRPGTLTFPKSEGGGYVHWLGKGDTDQQEWTFRIYSAANTAGRENRCSFYLFNLAGGLGAGSYVQEPVEKLTWYHYVAVVDTNTDTITWYKNGVKVDTDAFQNSSYHITPRNGTAPLRIGTRDFGSYFKGAIDNLYIYDRALTPAEIQSIYTDQTR